MYIQTTGSTITSHRRGRAVLPRCFTEPSVTIFTVRCHVRQWQKLTRRSLKAAQILLHAHRDYLLFSQVSIQPDKMLICYCTCSWWTCKDSTPAVVSHVSLNTSPIVPTYCSAYPAPFWKDKAKKTKHHHHQTDTVTKMMSCIINIWSELHQTKWEL